jgi:hypothetical protein
LGLDGEKVFSPETDAGGDFRNAKVRIAGYNALLPDLMQFPPREDAYDRSLSVAIKLEERANTTECLQEIEHGLRSRGQKDSFARSK